jgi:Bacterial protein of unknown function (Gcw_chp)
LLLLYLFDTYGKYRGPDKRFFSSAKAGTHILVVMRGRIRGVARVGRYGNAMLQILVLFALPPLACAADGPWSASVAATTDYVFRGVSQTYESGALQLGVNYQSPQG